jgi:hypothetical protein
MAGLHFPRPSGSTQQFEVKRTIVQQGAEEKIQIKCNALTNMQTRKNRIYFIPENN